MGDTSAILKIVGIAVAIVVAGIALLVGISFSDCEYHQYGFRRRKSTGAVDTSKVYVHGRYLIGPDHEFKHFPADAQHINLTQVAVFTSDRLTVWITASFLYFLRKDELPLLHKAYDIYYEPILRKNALDALKVAATGYSTREFVGERKRVESALFKAVKDRLGGKCCELDCAKSDEGCQPGCKARETCTETDYGFFASIKYFYLQALGIPEDVKGRFLRALVLNEETETEQFVQNEKIVQKMTDQQVNEILNAAAEISQNATAQSDLVNAQAHANSTATVEKARSNGLKSLYTRLGIASQDHKSSFDYLRTLKDLPNVHLSVDFNQLIVGPMKP